MASFSSPFASLRPRSAERKAEEGTKGREETNSILRDKKRGKHCQIGPFFGSGLWTMLG